MTTTMNHPTEALEHAQKAIAHYERLIAGDGITCADLVVFGAQLAKALRQKAVAERQLQTETQYSQPE